MYVYSLSAYNITTVQESVVIKTSYQCIAATEVEAISLFLSLSPFLSLSLSLTHTHLHIDTHIRAGTHAHTHATHPDTWCVMQWVMPNYH